MRQRYSITLHRAGRAGGTQLGAQFLGTGTALGPDVDPRPTHAAARDPVVQDAWFPPAQDGRVPLVKLMIRGERRRIRGASDQLHAPGIQWLHDGGGRARHKAGDLLTGHGGGGGGLRAPPPRRRPLPPWLPPLPPPPTPPPPPPPP